MKKLSFICLMVLLLKLNSQELKFYTSENKTEVKQASFKTKDLTVKVPLPANISNYDKIVFLAIISPYREFRTQVAYHITWEKEALIGKKEVEIVLKSEDGINEFHKGFVLPDGVSYGDASALKIDWPATDLERTDQIWKLSFELQGLKFERIAVNTLGVRAPVYNSNSLKKWNNYLPYDYGAADQAYYSQDKTFSVSKKYDADTEISAGEDKGQQWLNLSAGPVLFQIKTFDKTTVEEIKQDIVKSLKNNSLATGSNTKFDYNIELCYPCYAKKIRSCTEDKATINIVKESCSSITDWKPSKVGGLDGFVLDIPNAITKYEWRTDGTMVCVDSTDPFPWKKLFIFVVENKGKVYTGVLEHRNGTKPASELAIKLFNDFFSSFKIY